MWDTYAKLRDLLDRRERRRALLVFALVLFMGLVEMARVISVAPFVAVLTDPTVIETNRILATAYDRLGFQSTGAFTVFLGLVLFAFLVGVPALTMVSSWAMLRFGTMRTYALSRRLFAGYLDRPYEWFLGTSSSDLGKTLLSEVDRVVEGALLPAMQFVAKTVVTGFIVAVLVFVDPLLALIVAGVLGGGYWLIYFAGRDYLWRIGHERIAANRDRFRVTNETFGGIKEVKVMGLEAGSVRRFERPSYRFARLQVLGGLVSQLPQHLFEALAFTLVLGIIWYQVAVHGGFSQALPTIALYALAAQRLMPALASLYHAGTRLRFVKPALDALHRDLVDRRALATAASSAADATERVRLRDQIELRSVSYRYPKGPIAAVHDVSIVVPARTVVGLVGQTGAGKTTLADVILGLLEPQAGKLLVDGIEIDGANLRAWQKSVGYVPQNIFLADDTIAANIAFGVERADIDMAQVAWATQVANLDDFVGNELEQGFETVVGERGIRLSGGQRQRIGIARALYRDPDLIVMDEGTAALDNISERAVIDAVRNLADEKTIILIAHRLTTVRHCSTIFLLERGRVAASGSYRELIEKSERFRELAAEPSGP